MTQVTDMMVVAHTLKKRYTSVEALKGIDLEVRRGEIFGIIGCDGAGKTSLFRILTTLLLADEGKAAVDGADIVGSYREIRKIIGYMPSKFSLYQDLSVEENLTFFASIFGTTIEDNYYLVEDIYRQIEPFRKRRAGKLSGGMKQKPALCCALIHKPKVLFLDEPTTGVDPVSRKEFWQMLLRLKEQGITILVSTPYMDEASLCSRIALIHEGRFLTVDTPENIVSGYPDKIFAVRANDMHHLLYDLRASSLVKSACSFGENYHVTLAKDNAGLLHDELSHAGHTGLEIETIVPTIEDCFMMLSKPDKDE